MKFKLENLNTHTRTKITKINGLKMYLKQIKYKTKEELDKEVPDTSAGCGAGEACGKKPVIQEENRV